MNPNFKQLINHNFEKVNQRYKKIQAISTASTVEKFKARVSDAMKWTFFFIFAIDSRQHPTIKDGHALAALMQMSVLTPHAFLFGPSFLTTLFSIPFSNLNFFFFVLRVRRTAFLFCLLPVSDFKFKSSCFLN